MYIFSNSWSNYIVPQSGHTILRSVMRNAQPQIDLANKPEEGRFIRRILVALNAIKTIDNEMINLIKLHYLLFELHPTRPKFDV
jgi:hypothetical protein